MWCVLLLAFVSGAPGAPTPTVEERIVAAKRALDSLEYETAAEELMIAATDPRATPQERVEANLYAGIANRVLGRDVDARLNFTYVLKNAPETRLPADTPPKIASFFELVRQEVEASTPTVVVAPAPAPAIPPPPVDADAAAELSPLVLVGSGVLAAALVVGVIALGAALALEIAASVPTLSGDVKQLAAYGVIPALGVVGLAPLGALAGGAIAALGVME